MSSAAPVSARARQQFVAHVAANIPLCREHFRLVLRLADFPPTEPGQFIQIAGRDLDADFSPESEMTWEPGQWPDLRGQELMSPLAFLRRPFSLAGRRDTADGVELDIIHRVVGVATDWMSRLKMADPVYILGPLGNRFELPAPEQTALLVGGGVGIPPMLYLGHKLTGRKLVAFSGALTRDLLPFTLSGEGPAGPDDAMPRLQVGEFAAHGIPSVITTDDGSYGFRGFVTQALEKYLDDNQVSGDDAARRYMIYTCGPEPMMKRVGDIAARRGIACQIAVERAMACGMGTCQSCVIRVKATGRRDGREWVYKLACTDGPVFQGKDLLW